MQCVPDTTCNNHNGLWHDTTCASALCSWYECFFLVVCLTRFFFSSESRKAMEAFFTWRSYEPQKSLSWNWLWMHAIQNKSMQSLDILLGTWDFPTSIEPNELYMSHSTHIFNRDTQTQLQCKQALAAIFSAPLFHKLVVKHKSEFVKFEVFPYFSRDTLYSLFQIEQHLAV